MKLCLEDYLISRPVRLPSVVAVPRSALAVVRAAQRFMPASDAAGDEPDGLGLQGPPRIHGVDAVDDADLGLPGVQTSLNAGSDQTSRGANSAQTSRTVENDQTSRGAGDDGVPPSIQVFRDDADAQASVASLDPRGDDDVQAQPSPQPYPGSFGDRVSLPPPSRAAPGLGPGDVPAGDGVVVICRNNVAINEKLSELLRDEETVAPELVIDFALHVVRDKYSTRDREPDGFEGDVLFQGEEYSDLYSGTTFIIIGPKTSLKFLTSTEDEVARLWRDLHVRDLGCGTVFFVVNDFVTDRLEVGYHTEQPPPSQWVLLEYPIDLNKPATCFESAPVRQGECSRAFYNAKLLLRRLDTICRVWCTGEREMHTGECPKHGRDADAALQIIVNLENYLTNTLPICLDTSGTAAEKRRVLRQRLMEYDQIRRMRILSATPREIEQDDDKPSSDFGVSPGTPTEEVAEAFAQNREPGSTVAIMPTLEGGPCPECSEMPRQDGFPRHKMGCKFEQSKGDNQPKLYTEMHSLADRRLGKRARQRAQETTETSPN